jgi:anti-sigma factor RsiW
MSHQMKQDVVDEQLLMYLDNELTLEEVNKVELKLATDKNYKLQYEGLLKTRLDKNEIISIHIKKNFTGEKMNEASVHFLY